MTCGRRSDSEAVAFGSMLVLDARRQWLPTDLVSPSSLLKVRTLPRRHPVQLSEVLRCGVEMDEEANDR